MCVCGVALALWAGGHPHYRSKIIVRVALREVRPGVINLVNLLTGVLFAFSHAFCPRVASRVQVALRIGQVSLVQSLGRRLLLRLAQTGHAKRNVRG